MSNTIRGVAVAATVAGLSLSSAPLVSASAKHSRGVTIHLNAPNNGTVIRGTWKASGLGSGTVRGTLHIPVARNKFSTQGGTFTTVTYSCKGAFFKPPKYVGCWKVVGSSGKFRGMSGGGKLAGNLDGHATYTGTVRF